MQTFKDKTGREWTIELTIGAVERLRKTSAFDLYDPTKPVLGRLVSGLADNRQPSLQERIGSDWSLFWELLFLIVEPDLTAAGVSADEFGRLMAADCLVEARLAFWQEWADFFRRLQNAPFARALELQQDLWAKTMELAKARMESPELKATIRDLEKQISQAMDRALEESLRCLEESVAGETAEPPVSAPASSSG